MKLKLRKAIQADMDLIFQWANDAVVRANAFHTEQIPYENHVAWYTKQMKDADSVIYLMETEKEQIGQIRFSIEDGKAIIDYSVAAAFRGHGYGTKLVELGIEKLKKQRPDVSCFLAQVKYENPSSARVFEKCGFTRKEKPEYIEYTKC